MSALWIDCTERGGFEIMREVEVEEEGKGFGLYTRRSW